MSKPHAVYPPDMGKCIEDPNECNWRVRDDHQLEVRILSCSRHGKVWQGSIFDHALLRITGIPAWTNVMSDAWKAHVEAHKPEPVGQLPVHLL